MDILGTMWNEWASEENLVTAAKRVGISKDGLNVENMQQDKFEQAAILMSTSNNGDVPTIDSTPSTPMKTRRNSSKVSVPTTPRSQSKTAQSKGRYGSKEYWKAMYEMSQSLIEETYEKSLQLSEVPGLLSMNLIKPRDITKKKSTRVTNVHGSMEGQDILSKVAELEKEKQKKIQESVERKEKMVQQKELFYRCKVQCCCEGECKAKLSKESPKCHSILKSVCSKMACRIDGKKPVMILPASASSFSGSSSRKRPHPDSDTESSSEESMYDSDSDCDVFLISESDDGQDSTNQLLKSTWASVGLDHKEENLIGKWYGVVYRGKKKVTLYIAKVLNRFLMDVDGPVKSLLMECLMPKTGSGNQLKAAPSHLPADVSEFEVKDIIYGPVKVIPKERDSRTFIVPNYEDIVSHFAEVKSLDIDDVYTSFCL